MSKTRGVARFSAELVVLIFACGGLYRLVRRLNDIRRHQSQLHRLERLEEALTAEYGPITPAAWARAEQLRWPR